jgi:riboflavin kinase / FMN adenylyltransferase
MRVFRHTGEIPQSARGAVVALGNFDGVHGGHRGVIDIAQGVARAINAPCGVVTFEPHPRSVFRPQDPPFRLSPFRVKTRLLEALGVDLLFVLHFDEALRCKPAETFVRQDLAMGLGVRHVVFGHDFAFGHGRTGNAGLLETLGAEIGFGVTAVPPIIEGGGVRFSSTAVRRALAEGRPRDAALFLGHPFEIEGRVQGGRRLGRTIGFPTANVGLGEYVRPAFGVYAVEAGVDEGPRTRWLPGVANIGVRPTVAGDEEPRLEVHLFDFDGDIYERHLRVRLIDYLRPEQRFDGLPALQAQIKADAAAARQALAARGAE